ncbi:alpha/beta hydrolase [Kineococcus rhizosphaerae]|nr:alpha/beta hydrolase [Kineococcus rhizosphaerae]
MDELVDPALRQAAHFWRRWTPRTPVAYRRQVRAINALRILNTLSARPPRGGVGVTRERVHGDLRTSHHWTTRRDGTPMRLMVMRPAVARTEVTGVLWIHGGGYATGSPEQSRALAERLVAATDSVVVLPDYRLSVQMPYPAALHDCYDALIWLRDHAGELGVARDQLVVGGESAGGGLTAAVSLLTRDLGQVAIAFQVPLYPMLDDRPTESSRSSTAPVWNTVTNDTAWDLYLGPLRAHAKNGTGPPAYAAPARALDLSGLPPTLTFVGDLEPFYDEVVDYVRRLQEAGVPVLHRIFPGAFHGFDLVAPAAPTSQEARAFTLDGFRQFSATFRSEQPSSAAD